MVMGPTHAMSGAAAWLIATPALVAVTDAPATPAVTATATAVCAGAALLPDIDCPSSTVARSFGLPSVAVSHLVDAVSAAFYNLTKTTNDEPRHSGHRTLTHTAVFTVGLGLAVAVLCGVFGKYAVIGTLFVTLGLAIRGLLSDWAKQQGWLITTVAALGGAVAAWWLLPHGNYWWVGAAVAVGATMHLLGDMITKNGCPIAAPFPYRGRNWWEFTLPDLLRIRAGGWFEYTVLLPVLTAATVLGGMHVYTPALFADVVGAVV